MDFCYSSSWYGSPSVWIALVVIDCMIKDLIWLASVGIVLFLITATLGTMGKSLRRVNPSITHSPIMEVLSHPGHWVG